MYQSLERKREHFWTDFSLGFGYMKAPKDHDVTSLSR